MRSSKTLPMLLLYALLGGCFVQPLDPDEETDETSVSPLTEAEPVPAGLDQVIVHSDGEETSDDEEQNPIGGALEPKIFKSKPSPEPWYKPQYVPPTDPDDPEVSRTSSR